MQAEALEVRCGQGCRIEPPAASSAQFDKEWDRVRVSWHSAKPSTYPPCTSVLATWSTFRLDYCSLSSFPCSNRGSVGPRDRDGPARRKQGQRRHEQAPATATANRRWRFCPARHRNGPHPAHVAPRQKACTGQSPAHQLIRQKQHQQNGIRRLRSSEERPTCMASVTPAGRWRRVVSSADVLRPVCVFVANKITISYIYLSCPALCAGTG